MTAIALFDVLFGSAPSIASPHTGSVSNVQRLAAELVAWSLAEWDRVARYETDFSPADWSNPMQALEIERSIYSLHEQWASEATQILARVQRLASAGHPVPKTEALEDALGFTRARLKMTPEKISRSMEQVRAGQSIPAKELRDELRARLRA